MSYSRLLLLLLALLLKVAKKPNFALVRLVLLAKAGDLALVVFVLKLERNVFRLQLVVLTRQKYWYRSFKTVIVVVFFVGDVLTGKGMNGRRLGSGPKSVIIEMSKEGKVVVMDVSHRDESIQKGLSPWHFGLGR